MLPGQLLKQTVQGSLRGQPVDSALLALHVLLHVSSEGTVTDGAVAFEGGGGDVVLENRLTVQLRGHQA